MVDFAAGHLTSAQSHPIVAALDAELGGGRDGVRFHPGVEYRHLCVVPASGPTRSARRRTHITGMPVCNADRARGGKAAHADGRVAGRRTRGRARRRCVGDPDLAVVQGVKPALPRFDATYGVTGRMSSAVDLVQGLGVLTGIEVVDVPRRDCGFDNDYAAQARAYRALLY